MRWRSSAAAARASGPGGMRCCADDRARCWRRPSPRHPARSRARRRATVAPRPPASSLCRATMIRLVVAMSMNAPPTGRVTTTWPPARAAPSSGCRGSRQRLTRRVALPRPRSPGTVLPERVAAVGVGQGGDGGVASGVARHPGVAAHTARTVAGRLRLFGWHRRARRATIVAPQCDWSFPPRPCGCRAAAGTATATQ